MTVPVDIFFVDKDSRVPLQVQIRESIVRGVAEGRMPPGARLPSSRALAAWLGISRATVALALEDLCAQGLLAARDRAGIFVAGREALPQAAPVAAPAGSFAWDRHLDHRHVAAQRKDRVADWRRYRWSFTYGQTDARLIDRNAWREASLQALSASEFPHVIDDHYSGDDPALLDYICTQVLPRRGIRAHPGQVLLTQGAQNGLWLTCQLLLGRGGACAIEDPAYPGLREILAQSPAVVHPVAVDPDGLPPTALPPGLSAVFMTASHQCPTGATMPLARRVALLDRAALENFVIVEDDYEVQMSFEGTHLPALKAMDHAGCVVYVGSFSKSVFPGLRIGYLVADEAFIQEARALRALSLRHLPGQMQRSLASYLSLGFYDSQLRRMRAAFEERRNAMRSAIAAEGLTPADVHSNGGSSLWMRLPPAVDANVLAEQLRARDVLIEPGAAFYANPLMGRSFYRLAWSSVSAADIPGGIARIAEAIRGF